MQTQRYVTITLKDKILLKRKRIAKEKTGIQKNKIRKYFDPDLKSIVT